MPNRMDSERQVQWPMGEGAPPQGSRSRPRPRRCRSPASSGGAHDRRSWREAHAVLQTERPHPLQLGPDRAPPRPGSGTDLVGQEERGNALHPNEINVSTGTCQSCLRLLASCKVHAILAANARTGPANTRAQMPALLKGLIFGPSGAAMLPTATRKGQPTLPLLREPGCVEARTGSVPGPAAASAPARSSRCWP
jgi:hypothetical protein